MSRDPCSCIVPPDTSELTDLAAPSPQTKLLTPGMRLMLFVAAFLVFSVGVSLFLLTGKTDRYFAWTIANPLTAAFLGAGYWASGLLEFAAGRETAWANARVGVPAVLLFTVLTLVVTLVHWESFHFDDPDFVAQAGTWFWLAVYALVPMIMGTLLLQVGWSVEDAVDTSKPLPTAMRVAVFAQGGVMLLLGAALLVQPSSVDQLWPWSLTELTGRAIGAWLCALGVAALHTSFENNLRRVRPVLISYLLLAVLQIIALLRYTDIPDWSNVRIWIYVAFLVSMLVCGAILCRVAFFGRQEEAEIGKQLL